MKFALHFANTTFPNPVGAKRCTSRGGRRLRGVDIARACIVPSAYQSEYHIRQPGVCREARGQISRPLDLAYVA